MSNNPVVTLAINYLARFARTERQVRTYLRRKACVESDISEAIAYLRDRGLIQDDQYARSFVESKIAHRDGPLKIKQQLFQKGIPPDVAERLLREMYPVELQVENASALIERKEAYLRAKPGREKAMRFVASRGFPSYVIIQAFRRKSTKNTD